MSTENPLITEPIPRLVRRIAVPASIGFFFNTMFNVVDTYFAGLISTDALLMLAGTILVFLLSDPLMKLFSTQPKVVETGAVYLKIDALAFYAYVILSICVAALQGMKRPVYAMVIGLWRQIAAPVLLFWFLTEVLGSGILGIWWGIFGITWSAALFTLFYARRTLRKVENSRRGVGTMLLT